jgi:hypothetical protein
MLEEQLVTDKTVSVEPRTPRRLGSGTGSWNERAGAAEEHRQEAEAAPSESLPSKLMSPMPLVSPKPQKPIDQELRDLAVRRAALDAEEARLLRHAEDLQQWLQQRPRP